MTKFHLCRLEPIHTKQVSIFFSLIENDPSAQHFHPHPFTKDYAKIITNYQGKDLYLGLFEVNNMIGYGILRGWDAGYEIPSLGVYVSSKYRGQGISKFFLSEMHTMARNKGAVKIRLKVYSENIIAKNLYKAIGYKFNYTQNNQLVGYYSLTNRKKSN